MAITRAQIPEQIDIFANGGAASTSSSLTPQDIIDLYGSVQSPPVTAADIEAQAAQLSGLFPQPRKPSIYDLASEVGAGLVSGASSPGGFGVGLTAGLQSFNEVAQKKRAEAEKLKQEMSLLAYQQVEAKRQEQMAQSKELLEMQFEAALKGAEGIFPDGTLEGAALNFILAAENNPKIKDSTEYKFAVEIASKPRRSLRTTETGTIEVETPGLNIRGLLGPQEPPAPSELNIAGTKWTFVRRDANNDPIYTDGTKEQVIKPKE